MENLKYGLFDLFAYATPGAFFVFCTTYVRSFEPAHPLTMVDPLVFSTDIRVFPVLIFIICAYITGFILSVVANHLLKALVRLKFHIFKKLRAHNAGHTKTPKSLKYVIIRESAKETGKCIEIWNVMKNFSATLALCILVLAVLYFARFPGFGVLPLFTSFGLFALLIEKAMEYHSWAMADLDNAYERNKDK